MMPGATVPPPARGDDPGIAMLTDPASIDALRDEWLALRPHRDAHPDFFRLIITILPQAVGPMLITLRRPDGGLQALLVCRLDRSTPRARVGPWHLPTPALLSLNLIHGGLLGEIGPAEAARLHTALDGLLREGRCDALFLHEAPQEHPLAIQAEGSWTPRGLPAPHHFLELTAGSEPFPAELSKNERYNQRRRSRQLQTENDNQIEIVTLHGPADVARLMDEAEQIAATSYQRRLGVGFKHSPVMAARLTRCAELGWLRGWVLRLRGRPAAFWIATLHDGVLISDFLSFDLAHAAHSPGMYLSLMAIGQSEAEYPQGLVVDFGPGGGDYKARLGTRSGMTVSLYRFGRRPRAILARGLVGAAARADVLGRALLRRLGVAERLRRWTRRKQ